MKNVIIKLNKLIYKREYTYLNTQYKYYNYSDKMLIYIFAENIIFVLAEIAQLGER